MQVSILGEAWLMAVEVLGTDINSFAYFKEIQPKRDLCYANRAIIIFLYCTAVNSVL